MPNLVRLYQGLAFLAAGFCGYLLFLKPADELSNRQSLDLKTQSVTNEVRPRSRARLNPRSIGNANSNAILVTSVIGSVRVVSRHSPTRLEETAPKKESHSSSSRPQADSGVIELKASELPYILLTGDEIQTAAASTADLETGTGHAAIRLLSQTRMSLKASLNQPDRTILTLLAGDIESLRSPESRSAKVDSKSPSLRVEFDGQVLNLESRYPKRSLLQSPEDAVPAHPTALGLNAQLNGTEDSSGPKKRNQAGLSLNPANGTGSGSGGELSAVATDVQVTRTASELSNDEVRQRLKSQGGGIQKCYVSMVSRLAESGKPARSLPSGEMILSFSIEPSGKVSKASVKKSPFQDATFERCVADSVTRIRFRAFQAGRPLEIESLPVRLE